MMQAGLIVYKTRDGEHYCSFEFGKKPSVPPSAELIFDLLEIVETPQEIFVKAREEADSRDIGKIINLPD